MLKSVELESVATSPTVDIPVPSFCVVVCPDAALIDGPSFW